jgi:SAM-dependent methyltransferase
MNSRVAGSRFRSSIPVWTEDPLTTRARLVWNGADPRPIARRFAGAAAAYAARLELWPGESVLDVACGTGNLAIAAARAGGTVAGVDLAPSLIAHARTEARLARCRVAFEVGDAEALPYGIGQFSTTVSMFGVMYAHRPDRVAAELIRVTRLGGRIALANWTADGFVGQVLRAHQDAAPLPAGVPSPLDWGDPAVVAARFGDRVSSLSCTRRTIELRFPYSPAAVTELFATCYGPTVAALRDGDPDAAGRLSGELTRLFQEHNLADDGTTSVSAEYLDVQARVA